jgi:hypothetical protein
MAEHKKKKRKPRRIVTTRHDDGSYSHEHYHDGDQHPQFAGTSQTMDDLKQHMEDHFGGGAPADGDAPAAAAGEPEGGGEGERGA